jgi:DNA-binding response OmpR family regulator
MMKKILIVDDQPEIRELVEMTLSREDYQIFTADSGEKAIQVAKSEKPELILMDVSMPPGMNGVETTRIIKSDPETKGCIIIMLSGKGLEEDKMEGLNAGAKEYFVKPFSPLALITKVEEVLG